MRDPELSAQPVSTPPASAVKSEATSKAATSPRVTGLAAPGGASSSSVTSMTAVRAPNPSVEAVIVALCDPSTAASSTGVTREVAPVAPAGMVTVPGTVAVVTSSLARVTTNAASVGPLRVTVRDAPAPPSEMLAASRDSASLAVASASRYLTER